MPRPLRPRTVAYTRPPSGARRACRVHCSHGLWPTPAGCRVEIVAGRERRGARRRLKEETLLITTGPSFEGRRITGCHGIVTGDATLGANVFKVTGDATLGANVVRGMFAGIRDIVGGRSAACKKEPKHAKGLALTEIEGAAAALDANAIVAIDPDGETVGQSGSMLMVSVSGTAVTLE